MGAADLQTHLKGVPKDAYGSEYASHLMEQDLIPPEYADSEAARDYGGGWLEAAAERLSPYWSGQPTHVIGIFLHANLVASDRRRDKVSYGEVLLGHCWKAEHSRDARVFRAFCRTLGISDVDR